MTDCSKEELGTLVVVVLKARNLRDKHSLYKQDVFAQLVVSGSSTPPKNTRVDVRGGQHPVWDEEIRFTFYEDSQKSLDVSCWSKEPRRDELIGQCTVDVTETLRTGEFDDWVTLQEESVYRGEIYLEMTFFAAGPPPSLSRRPSRIPPSDRLNRPSHAYVYPTKARPHSTQTSVFSSETHLAPPAGAIHTSPQNRNDASLPPISEQSKETTPMPQSVPEILRPGTQSPRTTAASVSTTDSLPASLLAGSRSRTSAYIPSPPRSPPTNSVVLPPLSSVLMDTPSVLRPGSGPSHAASHPSHSAASTFPHYQIATTTFRLPQTYGTSQHSPRAVLDAIVSQTRPPPVYYPAPSPPPSFSMAQYRAPLRPSPPSFHPQTQPSIAFPSPYSEPPPAHFVPPPPPPPPPFVFDRDHLSRTSPLPYDRTDTSANTVSSPSLIQQPLVVGRELTSRKSPLPHNNTDTSVASAFPPSPVPQPPDSYPPPSDQHTSYYPGQSNTYPPPLPPIPRVAAPSSATATPVPPNIASLSGTISAPDTLSDEERDHRIALALEQEEVAREKAEEEQAERDRELALRMDLELNLQEDS